MEVSRSVRMLRVLAPSLAVTDRKALHALWRQLLQVSASEYRPSLLIDLPAIAEVIVALGGADGTADAVHALERVGSRWP